MLRTAATHDSDWLTTGVVPWILRIGLVMCYVGHGAFGIITKAAWLPYFAVAGIDGPTAWGLMPWIGAMDIAMGLLVLVWPCRALFACAAVWTIWTALLRPLAGEGWPEFFERAGNYGVPLAMLAVVGWRGDWFDRLPQRWPDFSDRARLRLGRVLRATTALLLAGHAGCSLLLHKASLTHHFEVFSPTYAPRLMVGAGYLDLLLAIVVCVAPGPRLLLGVCLWKLGTEGLFLFSGVPAPLFEVIERGGSYTAPLALAIHLWADQMRGNEDTVPSQTETMAV